MCESLVLLKEDMGISTLMAGATVIVPVEDGLSCSNMFGETKVFHNVRLAEIDLFRHRVIIERV